MMSDYLTHRIRYTEQEITQLQEKLAAAATDKEREYQSFHIRREQERLAKFREWAENPDFGEGCPGCCPCCDNP